MPLVYEELRHLARYYLRGESAEQTLQSAALVHEAYLRLVDWHNVQRQNRAQFFGVAAQMMRRVLVDRARERQAAKRGSGAIKLTVDRTVEVSADDGIDLQALDQALRRLEHLDAQRCRIVELRFFWRTVDRGGRNRLGGLHSYREAVLESGAGLAPAGVAQGNAS
jgi:RNA polymerase sigma factor (TIGR02999 family)